MVSAFDKNGGKTPQNKANASQTAENQDAPAPGIKAEDTSVKAESLSAETASAPGNNAQKIVKVGAEKPDTTKTGTAKTITSKIVGSKISKPRQSLVKSFPTRPAEGITAIAITAKSITAESMTAIGISFAELHEDFLRARRVEGIRPTTLRTYRGSLLPWEKWCADHGVEGVGQVLTKHAEDYLLSLQDRMLSERTIRNQAIVRSESWRACRATLPASACTAGRSPA